MEVTAVCDANILFDFLSVSDGEQMIYAMTRYFHDVVVPDVVLHEVKQLTPEKAEQFGLHISETPLEALTYSPNDKKLSMQDRACLFLSQTQHWICITNDKKLRTCCLRSNGSALWGLELVVYLFHDNLILKELALAVGQEICRYNSRVTEKTYDEFVLALNKAEKEQADEEKEAESGFLVSKHVAFVATSH